MLQQEYWDDEDSDPEIYHYIVPAGLKVTFQDQAGNMITRCTRKTFLNVRDFDDALELEKEAKWKMQADLPLSVACRL